VPLVAINALSQMVDIKITEQQAEHFARAALRPSASTGILERMGKPIDPRFYMYAGESPEGSMGSPIFGYFAVNPSTGDVWDVEGSVCTPQVTKAVKQMQRDLRKRSGLNSEEYHKLHKMKPSVCD
jgi:hypothetical protein